MGGMLGAILTIGELLGGLILVLLIGQDARSEDENYYWARVITGGAGFGLIAALIALVLTRKLDVSAGWFFGVGIIAAIALGLLALLDEEIKKAKHKPKGRT